MPDNDADLSRLEILVLGRLSSGQKRPPSETAIAETLTRLAVPAATRSEWQTRLGAILADLRRRSLVDDGRCLTEAGRQALARALGLSKAPTWKDVQSRHLPALALGLDADAHIATAEQLQAALISAYLGVDLRRTPAQVFSALVASEIGLPRGRVTLNRIRDHLLARRTGLQLRGSTAQVAARLASRSLHAVSSAELRPTLVKRWLSEQRVEPVERLDEGRPEPGTPAPGPSRDGNGFSAVVSDAGPEPIGEVEVMQLARLRRPG